MITVDAKYLVRPITREMAIEDFKQGYKILAIHGEPDNVESFQIFYPEHHGVDELRNWGHVDSKWFLDWE